MNVAECGWDLAELWMRSSRMRKRSIWMWIISSQMWTRSSRMWMRSSRMWMRPSRIRASDSQCHSRNSHGSIPASSDRVESKGRQMKQRWMKFTENPKNHVKLKKKIPTEKAIPPGAPLTLCGPWGRNSPGRWRGGSGWADAPSGWPPHCGAGWRCCPPQSSSWRRPSARRPSLPGPPRTWGGTRPRSSGRQNCPDTCEVWVGAWNK